MSGQIGNAEGACEQRAVVVMRTVKQCIVVRRVAAQPVRRGRLGREAKMAGAEMSSGLQIGIVLDSTGIMSRAHLRWQG